MNKHEVLVQHTVRKAKDGKPLQTKFPANVWLKIKRIQTYPQAGKWEEVTQTVPTPPEATAEAPAKKPTRRKPATKKTTAK